MPPVGGKEETTCMWFRINFRRIFITGAFIVLPALVTFFLLSFLLDWVDHYVTPHLRKALSLLPSEELQVLVSPFLPLLSLVLVLVVVFFIGLLGTNYIGKRIIAGFDRLILRIPLVRGIYGAAKQLFEAISSPGSRAFDAVVLVEFPRKGTYVVAFLTRAAAGEVQAVTEEECVYLFIPTTPNPTSGWLLIAPRSEVIPLRMSVEDAMKLIVSGGIVSPPMPPEGPLAKLPAQGAPAAEGEARPAGTGEEGP
jgi:uncharacterized membrane protein